MAKKKTDDVAGDESYFVITDDGNPMKILFKMDEAIATNEDYIDSFCKDGSLVKTYERQDDGSYILFADHKNGMAPLK